MPGPDEILLQRDQVLNTYGTDFVEGEGEGQTEWDVGKYCEGMEVVVGGEGAEGAELTFDVVNIHPPLANALRRILIAEVPTMAIEKVFLYQNTSVVQDEVLCHRMGLIPIKVDPHRFKYLKPNFYKTEGPPEEQIPHPEEGLIFELKVRCTKKPNAPKESSDPTDLYEHAHVYTKDMKWIPIGDQETIFGAEPPRPMFPDILIDKLRPGNEIELRAHCVKGIGRDHAKFSPVATATYRLLPVIRLKSKITGEAAHRLKDSFSDGVIEIVTENGEEEARVVDARKDMCSRNVLRFPDLAEAVELTRKRNHFIFSVESTGALRSEELVIEACTVMQEKCNNLLKYFNEKFSELIP